uniref:AlNc14C289G10206 protein n=1 Tax=Albugo laibachii Nc14 TaxID=890382 RepID=F0WV61_9STRA|nr:AlNc14C289G10206 [Albugo laibachii Nc14]|eukprot:CCA25300.1 AlNc14C289G10206 [Albugo laibachii Nc14]
MLFKSEKEAAKFYSAKWTKLATYFCIGVLEHETRLIMLAFADYKYLTPGYTQIHLDAMERSIAWFLSAYTKKLLMLRRAVKELESTIPGHLSKLVAENTKSGIERACKIGADALEFTNVIYVWFNNRVSPKPKIAPTYKPNFGLRPLESPQEIVVSALKFSREMIAKIRKLEIHQDEVLPLLYQLCKLEQHAFAVNLNATFPIRSFVTSFACQCCARTTVFLAATVIPG